VAEEQKSSRLAYEAYLVSPAWQALRKAAFVRDRHRCRTCDSPDDLEVHHRRYPPPGRWDLDSLDALTTLCRTCHGCITDELRSRSYGRSKLPSLSDSVRVTPARLSGT
jgi:5-methylcytosine-specific restriction endonuclease McrA